MLSKEFFVSDSGVASKVAKFVSGNNDNCSQNRRDGKDPTFSSNRRNKVTVAQQSIDRIIR